ncbi:MAG: hypothetical protein NFW04_09550 [Candidatus Accumulibacter sp.]|uniref:hypothetical protein n=1 Tax=Accumulibacter sp. TaxID=2053492 RepID=UPI0025CBEDB6|nr:hypothetical protein [Accumulibacter sp.]MCM8598889.1 hypothetical protein [Accumulibacter sp.]
MAELLIASILPCRSSVHRIAIVLCTRLSVGVSISPVKSLCTLAGDPLALSAMSIVTAFPTQFATANEVPAAGRMVNSAVRAEDSSASMRISPTTRDDTSLPSTVTIAVHTPAVLVLPVPL